MLLRFGVKNYKSIRDYQEISLISSSIKDSWVDLLETNSITEKILPAVGIYGSNASGKSTLIKSLDYFVKLIKLSHKRSALGETFVGRETFALDPFYKTQPTQFDCDFILDGNRYHYGFSMDDYSILEEWLYVFSRGDVRTTRRTLFYRDSSLAVPFTFGKSLKGLNRTVEELTRKDSLFISSAAQNNHKQLSTIYEYFSRKFTFRDADFHVNPAALSKYLNNNDMKFQILEFLQLADTGITNAEIVETPYPDDIKPFLTGLKELLSKQFPDTKTINEVIEEQFVRDTSIELKITHRSKSNGLIKFNLSEESSGTVAILGLLGPVFDSLKHGGLLIIDELNTNLHPLVSKQLIKLFSSKSFNLNFGQLIFATHDTNLLCPGVLRRDQIWFTEKDSEGATHLYPLSDIKTRSADNIEKGYLEGRFGAIPFFNNQFADD